MLTLSGAQRTLFGFVQQIDAFLTFFAVRTRMATEMEEIMVGELRLRCRRSRPIRRVLQGQVGSPGPRS